MSDIRSLIVILSLTVTGSASAVDFEQDVVAILQTHCLSCHDAATANGDLRLDLAQHARRVLSAGQPDDSLLIQQVSGPEPEMPQNAEPLTAAQVQTLRAWISQGAPWPEQRVLKDDPQRNLDWWSLKPIQIVKPPTPRNGETGNPVDAFLAAKLAEQGLKPRAQADSLTLLRRLSFDLTGLPPPDEDVNACSTADDERTDYERTVDKLLASPAFGEKWARHWLDLVRYGETHGYDKDKPRNNAWPYRDYVIAAFNDDKPYTRFVREQIAGDRLFPGTPDGVVALGFLAAGPWDFIGHCEVGEAKIDGRIAKHLDRDEMISATFNVFTSTTVQCAQCHHHKFDPVKMEDYYRLHAVFAAVDRADRVYAGLPPAQERQREEWSAQIKALQAQQDQIHEDIRQGMAARASQHESRITELKQNHAAPLRPQYGWHSQISRQQDVAKWVQIDLGEAKSVDQLRIFPAYDRFADIGAGFGFPLRYKVESASDAEFNSAVRLLHDASDENQPNPNDQAITVAVGGEPVRFIRITATKLAPRKNDYIFALGELEATDSESQKNLAHGAEVAALDSIEAGPRWGRANLTDGIYHRELEDPQALAELRRLEREVAAIEAELRTPELTEQLANLAQQRSELFKQIEALPPGQFVYAATTRFDTQGRFIATGGKPRAIQLLHRGDIGSPGEAMAPGMTPLWPSAEEELRLSSDATEADARAALADAIASQDNPLLWRSIVNRLWQWTFHQPLVGTPNDFGRMGMQPMHPELLDFLAARLRDDPDHSLKSIIRLLVTSDAYRRASEHDEAAARLDVGNRLLWRANRRRLTAEEFRDAMLALSGKLHSERGGPSFQDFVIEKPEHSPHYQYHLHDFDDPASHRRSIYRFVVRSQPQPLLTALDCADPSLSVAARDESTTALQALVQWNNPLVEAMSRHFGQRIEAAEGDRIHFACRLALGRDPLQSEHAALSEHLQSHGAASLARVIFNLNAFIYVD